MRRRSAVVTSCENHEGSNATVLSLKGRSHRSALLLWIPDWFGRRRPPPPLAGETRCSRRTWVCDWSQRRKVPLGCHPAAISCNPVASPRSVSRFRRGAASRRYAARARRRQSAYHDVRRCRRPVRATPRLAVLRPSVEGLLSGRCGVIRGLGRLCSGVCLIMCVKLVEADRGSRSGWEASRVSVRVAGDSSLLIRIVFLRAAA